MRRSAVLSFTLALIMLACGSLHAAELVDNPQYTSWAKVKPESTVTMQQDLTMAAMAMKNTVVQKLVEVTPEKAVLEMSITIDMAGQKHESKQKQDIPAKVEKGRENMPPGVKGSMKETGKEKVEVAGKSYECKVMEFDSEGPQGKATGKMWQSAEIPGGMAKMEMTMPPPREGTVKMSITAMDLK